MRALTKRNSAWILLAPLSLLLVACGTSASSPDDVRLDPTASTAERSISGIDSGADETAATDDESAVETIPADDESAVETTADTAVETGDVPAEEAATETVEEEPEVVEEAVAESSDEKGSEETIEEGDENEATESTGAGQDTSILTQDDRYEFLQQITADWNTNWNRHTVPYAELLPAQIRDRIRSIDTPVFESVDSASEWVADNEPVLSLEIGGVARAYPLQILTLHEIVNDIVRDIPVAVTFCPLCNSAVVFDRRLDGEVLEFGTSGLLRNSDLVMYDRSTESLWQQFTGEGLVGDLAGRKLTMLPSSLVSFANFLEAFPDGEILSRDTGFPFSYGLNPYVGYDTFQHSLSQGGSFALFAREAGGNIGTLAVDDRLSAVERVVSIAFDDGVSIAYPVSDLADVGVVNDTPGGHDLVVFHVPGTSSALDSEQVADGRDVGATGVFDPNPNGQKLTFSINGEAIVDDQTGTVWNVLGQAIEGPLAGDTLSPIVHGDYFWFSWAAFYPDTIIYGQ